MKTLAMVIFLLMAVGLAGCSSSKVVLLDAGKKENAVVVKTEAGELTLDEPNTYTELSSAKAIPSAVKVISQEELQARYGRLISAAPQPPQQFLLYFESGAAALSEESKKLFPEIEAAVKQRAPCDVNIIGHADRTGSKDANIKISLERAKFVHSWLLGRNLEIEKIVVESYGEEDPLIPTPDGVAEPRNRRVEVLIR